MGFHVRIDEQSESLIQLIQTDPSKVLGRLYSAYLLFLIGERDEPELKWLLENAKALDSLTGKDLAFAVFAKRFNLRLRTHARSGDRLPQNVGQLDANAGVDAERVTRLVKDGQFGMVVDGDEITAITYGTDLVARELGLIDKLPCIVVVDAIPSKSLCVVALDADVTASLLNVLRKAIAEFAASGADRTIRQDAERLIEMQDAITRERHRDTDLRAEIATATSTIDKLEARIHSGKATADPAYLQGIRKGRLLERQNAQAKLDRLPNEQPAALSGLEADLDAVLREHGRHSGMLFSRIFESQIRAIGLQSKLRAAKVGTLGYIGSVLKPEVLLKVWSLVNP